MGLLLLVDERRLAEELGRERWRGGRAPPLLARQLELALFLELACAAAAVRRVVRVGLGLRLLSGRLSARARERAAFGARVGRRRGAEPPTWLVVGFALRLTDQPAVGPPARQLGGRGGVGQRLEVAAARRLHPNLHRRRRRGECGVRRTLSDARKVARRRARLLPRGEGGGEVGWGEAGWCGAGWCVCVCVYVCMNGVNR